MTDETAKWKMYAQEHNDFGDFEQALTESTKVHIAWLGAKLELAYAINAGQPRGIQQQLRAQVMIQRGEMMKVSGKVSDLARKFDAVITQLQAKKAVAPSGPSDTQEDLFGGDLPS